MLKSEIKKDFKALLKIIRQILLFSFFISSAFAEEFECNQNYSALVVAEKNAEILYEKRSDNFSYPASLTKLMTLYLTFEALENNQLKLDQLLTVSARGEEISQVNSINTLHLKQGDKITVRQAIEGVTVKSFNEAALTLAEAVYGDEWQFVRKMNLKAQKLGMVNSSFRNSTGLHEEGQYSTSFDLARLALAIKKDFPKYYHFFALKKFIFEKQQYETHNRVLLEYKGVDGLKTGFTSASGFNLISSAKKNDERIISVVLGCPTAESRDKLTKFLLDNSFKKIAQKQQNDFFARLNLKGFDYSEIKEIKRNEDEKEFSKKEERKFKLKKV